MAASSTRAMASPPAPAQHSRSHAGPHADYDPSATVDKISAEEVPIAGDGNSICRPFDNFLPRHRAVKHWIRRSETIYLIWDNFGGDGTDELRSDAHRNAAAQKRTAAATRNRSDMT